MLRKMIQVEVYANGSVTIEYGSQMIAMSRFGHAASIIASELDPGKYEFPDTFTSDNECPALAWDSIMAALA